MAGGAELFAGTLRFAGGLARSHIGERADQGGKYGGRSYGDVVRTDHNFDLRRESGQSRDGFGVGVQIGFAAVEPDGRRIVGVAGEEQSVGAVEERDGIRSMARSRKDFDGAAAEVDDFAVVDVLGNGPGPGAIAAGIETIREFAADLARRDFGLGVFDGAFGILAGKVSVHGVDGVELPVAADVVVVGVRIQDDDGELRESGDEFVDITNAHAGVEQDGFLGAEDQVADGFFGLMRLVDGQGAGGNLIHLEPRVGNLHPFQRFVLRARKRFAPLGLFRLRPGGKRKTCHRGRKAKGTKNAESAKWPPEQCAMR
jgi:hypothetical protein